MSFEQNVEQVISYVYDFAVDGGAVSAIALRPLNVNKIVEGLSVSKAILTVETAIVSGSGTATIGDGADADGFFLDLVALAAGQYSSLSVRGGALLVDFDATAKVEAEMVYKAIEDFAATMTVATGALTAGKFKIDFFCYKA